MGSLISYDLRQMQGFGKADLGLIKEYARMPECVYTVYVQ